MIERRIRAVRRVDSSPVVRRVRERVGTGTARGQEIKVTLTKKDLREAARSCLGPCWNASLLTIPASIISRRPSLFQTSAAKSCVGRRAWERVGRNDTGLTISRRSPGASISTMSCESLNGNTRIVPHRRQRNPPRGIRRTRTGSLSGVSGVQLDQRAIPGRPVADTGASFSDYPVPKARCR